MEQIIEISLKLLLVLLLSGLIGLERELTGHKAGLRTQILVGVGAATFVMIGDYSSMDAGDMSRVFSGVITGVGFLGAGAIIKEGMNVRGLTTAASIWVTAAIGTAIGWNKYDLAILCFAITIISLSVLALLERKVDLKPSEGTLKLTLDREEMHLDRVINSVTKKGIFVKRTVVEKLDRGVDLLMEVEVPRKVNIFCLIRELEKDSRVKKIEWDDMENLNQLGRF